MEELKLQKSPDAVISGILMFQRDAMGYILQQGKDTIFMIGVDKEGEVIALELYHKGELRYMYPSTGEVK